MSLIIFIYCIQEFRQILYLFSLEIYFHQLTGRGLQLKFSELAT